MSAAPPTTPAESPNSPSAPAPQSPTPVSLRSIVSWAIIIASVAIIAGTNQVRSGVAAADNLDPLTPPNVRLEMTARYILCASHLLTSATGQKLDPNANLYIEQSRRYATTTVDKLRLVPLIANLKGKDAAIEELRSLHPRLQGTPLQADEATFQQIYDHGPETIDPSARTRLIKSHGWFGHLALSWNQPSNSPESRSVNQAALRTLAAVLALTLLAGGGVLAGAVLLIIGLVRFADGKVPLAYRRSTQSTLPFLEAFAVYVGGSVLLSLLTMWLTRSSSIQINAAHLLLSLIPVLLALSWPLLRGVSSSDWRTGLGWHRGQGVFREALLGLCGYVAGLPILALGAMVTLFLSARSGADPMHPIVNQARGGIASALQLYLLAAVYAPIVEESLFRGALFHHLRHRHGWWISALLVSFIFAAMHPQGWAAIPALGAIALVFAAIREWRATVIASAAAHALNNAVVMTLLVVTLS